MSKYDPWKNAKNFRILGFYIPVCKGVQPGDRRFYTELHRDDAYIASMGSDMPTYWLAALETYFKRWRLLDD